MTYLYTAFGVLVLGTTICDLLWTILWIEGGSGPLTTKLMNSAWTTLQRIGGRNSKRLTLAGPLILVVSITTWLVLLWVGWTLVFSGFEGSIVDTANTGPVMWADRFYFTGYSLFTLGNGGFAPNGSVWQIITVLVTASGMVFITMIVTYVLSILRAVAQKQSFAAAVSGLGMTGETVVRVGWENEHLRGFDLPLNTITTKLNRLTVNHMAYPILHYFYTQRQQYAAVRSVAVLDDALTLLQFGVPDEHKPRKATVKNAESTLENYLEMVDENFTRSDETPPAPDLDRLRDAGIPTVPNEKFIGSLERASERRQKLLGLIDADKRDWPQSGDDRHR